MKCYPKFTWTYRQIGAGGRNGRQMKVYGVDKNDKRGVLLGETLESPDADFGASIAGMVEEFTKQGHLKSDAEFSYSDTPAYQREV